MPKLVSQFNVWRHSEKQKLASYFRVNGVCGLRQIRPSDAQHPYATLCRRGVIEYGLYLSNTGGVWQYLRAIGPDYNVDAKVVTLCKGAWNFYGELATKDGEVIRRLITGNRGKCNILLYGAPGTGKTSFARTLVRELGRVAYEVKQGDDDGKNMKAEARMMGIQICNGQEDPESSMMIVDEADELLRGSSCGYRMFGFDRGGTTEKGVMNSILDEMRLPAIWIVNASAGAIDESVRRRFDYSVCFSRRCSRPCFRTKSSTS